MSLFGIGASVFNSMPDETNVKEFAEVQVQLHYVTVGGLLICANLFALTKKVNGYQEQKTLETMISSNGSSSDSKNAQGHYWVPNTWSTTVNLSSSQSGNRSSQSIERDHMGSSQSSSSKKSMK